MLLFEGGAVDGDEVGRRRRHRGRGGHRVGGVHLPLSLSLSSCSPYFSNIAQPKIVSEEEEEKICRQQLLLSLDRRALSISSLLRTHALSLTAHTPTAAWM